ncbi:hypothetical protein PVK06_002296 [Gossypium arboreum]|uniref:Uncharacterized protein n=1 Tax=Gossypium arboreum TaxID=29729 RepID=A0ABR0R372_GOSAR|nr:hypothetical protein PVK06_002296 [Gossypium arboreum]
MGVVKFDGAPSVGNLLPNHTDNRVNAIIENVGKRIKLTVAEVKTPLMGVWRKMVERGLIMQDLGSKLREVRNMSSMGRKAMRFRDVMNSGS